MGFLSSLFGIKGSQPKTSTVVQAQKLPEEISPFVKEILGEAQDLYKHEIERGYDPYTGQTIAPLTAEEEAAMAGISGLAGTTTPLLEEALETYRGGAEEFTPEVAQEYMSPYQRAVTDIEKREAERTFERDTMPRFEASGVEAGGLSGLGTRAGVQAAELQRNQNLLLADIEAKGLQSAFQDARMGFESQKAREQQMATNIGKTGPALFGAGLAEQGALQTVGEQKRGLGQSALDEAYYRFLEEKQFPKQTLADYSGMVYANPMAGLTTETKTSTGTPFVPSTGQQLMGMGLAGLNVFGMAGGFSPSGPSMNKIWGNKAAEGGPVLGRQEGGPLVYRKPGGKIWDETKVEYKETPSGLKPMMKGSDGRFYTQGGEDQRGLYYPDEVAVKREEISVSSDKITDKPGVTTGTEPASPLAPTPLVQPEPVGGRIPSEIEFEGLTAGGYGPKHALGQADVLGGTRREDYGAKRDAYGNPEGTVSLSRLANIPEGASVKDLYQAGGLGKDKTTFGWDIEEVEGGFGLGVDPGDKGASAFSRGVAPIQLTPRNFQYVPGAASRQPVTLERDEGQDYKNRQWKQETDPLTQLLLQGRLSQNQNRFTDRFGSIVPGRKPPVPLTDDPIRQVLTPEQEAAQQQALKDQYWKTLQIQERLRGSDDKPDAPGFGGLTGADVGNFFKHGGGLSQLANGGPVIYRQLGGQPNLQFGANDPKLSWYATRGNLAQRRRALSLMGAPKATISKSPTRLQAPSMSRSTPQLQQLRQRQQAQQQLQATPPLTPGGSNIGLKGSLSSIAGLPQGVPLSQSPGATIARQGQPRPVGTTAPDSAGGPLSITDTVKQTIQRLGQNFLGDRPSLSSRVDAAQKRLGETKGFSETVMTESFTDYQSATKKLQKRMNAKNKAKRTEFNKADEKASEEFFAAQEKAIKSGNNADIIAGAMDEANQRQIKQGGGTIAQWLTDIANVGVKGIGARRKEQGKELRELAKAKYKESRTDRKTNRSEELAEINKESLQESKNLLDKYGFSKELANMSRAKKTAAYAEIAAIAADEKGELAQIDTMAKLLDILGKGGKGGGKPANFNDKMKGIRVSVLDRFGFQIGKDGVTIRDSNNRVLHEDDPSLKKANDAIDREQAAFLEDLKILGTGYGAQVIALSRLISGRVAGQQAGATAPPKPSSHPAAKLGKDPNTGVPGWYIPNPDPNSKDKFLLVT